MSHAHPDFSLGGGELAAYQLFNAYRQAPNVEDAWFLARADRGRGPTGAIGLRRPGEYLWEQSVHDWHLIKAAHRESVTTRFRDLVSALQPTIVHTHHYAHLGLEYLRVLRQVDPAIRILMTLHEYMAICRNQGQMIKTEGRGLCSQESPDDCHRCFPDTSPEQFWLRKQFFHRHFDLVDQFVSPSEFLRARYVQWGLPAAKIAVIENGQGEPAPLPPRTLTDRETRNRFGFFGQITPFKGLDVVLRALHELPEQARRTIVLEVHGANLEQQAPAFRERIEALRDPLVEQGVVQWMGAYQPHELPARMAGIDWVVVPSVWWENSPMVIQEAFRFGRPLIVSAIGGMSEKVEDGVNGITVPPGNTRCWRDALVAAGKLRDEWEALRAKGKATLSHAACAEAHLSLAAGASGAQPR